MFDALTETQRKIVFEKDGKFVVRACPGSGKTYSVAARLAHKISSWPLRYQGIATISFTNAAWQEIERQITEHFKIQKPIPYPHFLGTIDSFINQFIFLPFGHLTMGCKRRPTLVGEPHGIWTGRYFAESLFDNLSYNISGELYIIRKGTIKSEVAGYSKIIKTKNQMVKAGYANQDDANYFGMKVLESYPAVAKALVQRFPMLMVDEAQDTSEIQMRIIDILIENGLNEVVLVGDPDQAIFEWHDAKPQLFTEKLNEWSQDSIILNENRRSSQNICNCTCRLSSLEETSVAINDEVKECQVVPKIVTYDNDTIKNRINEFINLCGENDIKVIAENVAVIYRSKKLFNTITGIKEVSSNEIPWEDESLYCRDIAKAKYLYDSGEFRKGFKLMERAIFKAANNANYCSEEDINRLIEKIGFIDFRKSVYNFINLLPKTVCSIGEWVDKTNERFKEADIKIELKIKKKGERLIFDQLFGADNKQIVEKEFRLGTVHSVKGATYEAVLLILKTKGIGSPYKSLLNKNVKIVDNEEFRIVYVGITRPRRILVLAVPDEENKAAWGSRLFH